MLYEDISSGNERQTMIRVILQGGLGNQMFEYAAAYSAACRVNQLPVLDQSFFETYHERDWCRPYELDIFALHKKATFVGGHKLEVKMLPKIAYWCRRKGVRQFGKYVFLPVKSTRKDQVLFGYFPDCHLFEAYREELLQEFAFVHKPNAANERLLKEIEACESVSVHIRRGDYLNSSNAGVFWHPTTEWYRQAMAQIEQQIEPRYFFFSDDIAWVKREFADVKQAVFVDINHGKEAYNDLRLMSCCKHNIVANSTFSWWGAWLNTNPDKIVFAPAQYYMNGASNERYRRTMLPNDWITIS